MYCRERERKNKEEEKQILREENKKEKDGWMEERWIGGERIINNGRVRIAERCVTMTQLIYSSPQLYRDNRWRCPPPLKHRDKIGIEWWPADMLLINQMK